MVFRRPRTFVSVAASFLAVFLPVCASAGPFGAWAAAIVAGDYRGHAGEPAEVFDNARRSIASRLVQIGFDPANVRQFSVRPGRYSEGPLLTDFDVLTDTMKGVTETARGGCFLYFTSHGGPQGIGFNDKVLPPDVMNSFIEDACPTQPTVIVISACYSGVFIPALANPNRIIITAARPDRPSFGCSEDYEYTFFDQCILEALPASLTFPELATKARECVEHREQQEMVTPPSEPQVYIGPTIEQILPYYLLTPLFTP
jgi:hypothetical protein